MVKPPVVKKSQGTSKPEPRPSTKTATARTMQANSETAKAKQSATKQQLDNFSVQVKDKTKIVRVNMFGHKISDFFGVIHPTPADQNFSVVHIPSGVRFGVGYDANAAQFVAKSLTALPVDWAPANLVQGKVSTDARFAGVAAYMQLINDAVEKHQDTAESITLKSVKSAWDEVTAALKQQPPF